jgi:hypothetical protein
LPNPKPPPLAGGLRTTLAGLDMPADLVPRIMAALRGTYPDLTAGLADIPAVLAVIRYWVQQTLADWEAKQAAGGPLSDLLDQVTAQYVTKTQQGRSKAVTDAADIRAAQ